jgi:hypothetical protein
MLLLSSSMGRSPILISGSSIIISISCISLLVCPSRVYLVLIVRLVASALCQRRCFWVFRPALHMQGILSNKLAGWSSSGAAACCSSYHRRSIGILIAKFLSIGNDARCSLMISFNSSAHVKVKWLRCSYSVDWTHWGLRRALLIIH